MSQRIGVLLVTLLLVVVPFPLFCTKIERELEGKIVGGAYTTISKFPHAAFLSITCGYIEMMCGSSIINQQILLTAAHCIVQCDEAFAVHAYAGNENLKRASVLRKAAAMSIHKDFSEHTLQNDIALVLLSMPLPLGNIKRVIIKPYYNFGGSENGYKKPNKYDKNENYVGNKVKGEKVKERTFVAGWGIINDESRERPVKLKYVEQPLCPREICRRYVSLYQGMLCAGNYKESKNRPTRGDSGSGLITSNNQQIGIVSFRNDYYPGLVIYTNVTYYYTWIRRTSEKMYCWLKEGADYYYS